MTNAERNRLPAGGWPFNPGPLERTEQDFALDRAGRDVEADQARKRWALEQAPAVRDRELGV